MALPGSRAPVIEEFEVRYNPPRGGFPANSFNLRGTGKLRVLADSIELIGSTRRLASGGEPTQVRIPLDRIVNVQHGGKGVGFEVLPQDNTAPSKPARVVIWLPAEESAQRLAARLPAAQTHEFQRTTREQVEFARRLRAVSPHAPVTRVLVAVNVLVFAAMVLAGAGFMKLNPEVHIQWGSNFVPFTRSGEWWRLFTSMFIHFGGVHILFNMAALWLYGDVTERLFGSARFALLYVVSGVAGSIASSLWNPMANSAGASGAVFGVFGAMFAFLTLRRTGVPMSIVAPHRKSMLMLLGINLFLGATHPYIDNAAHVGGLAAGYVAGLVLARPVDPERRAHPEPGTLLLFAVAAAIVLGALFVMGNRFVTGAS